MPQPTVDQLDARLSRLAASAVALDGVDYRSSTPKYATEADLLTGAGSQRYGGRWNPVGIAMVYTSLSPETAMAETLAHDRYYRIPIEDAMPRTFAAIRAKLQTVLDLRDATVRRRMRVSLGSLVDVDWRREMKSGREPLTQRLGRAAHRGAWEGLIVPSAADPDGHNLLIFPRKLAASSDVTLLNPEKLAE